VIKFTTERCISFLSAGFQPAKTALETATPANFNWLATSQLFVAAGMISSPHV